MLTIGQTPGKNRIVFADCLQAARALASSHLAGPAATQALAEGLAAVSLISADLGTPQEAVTFQLQTDGPIGSLLVEATFEGTLRGYTGKKLLPDFDEVLAPDLDAIFGADGTCNVIVSLPGSIISQSTVRLASPRPARALAQYCLAASQRQVAVRIATRLDGSHTLAFARGLLVELMPGSDRDEFARITSEMDSADFIERLASGDPQGLFLAPGVCGAFSGAERRDLRFACRCSREKALAALQALPAEERAEMASRGHPVDIYCHMCGKCHTFAPDELRP